MNGVLVFRPFGYDTKGRRKRTRKSSVMVNHYGGGLGRIVVQGVKASESSWGLAFKFAIDELR